MKTAVVAVTETGLLRAELLCRTLPEAELFRPEKGELKDLTPRLFGEYRGIVFVMAVGIAVRMIAPCVKDKHRDPAVVALDDSGRFAISLLSGHEGGANGLAYRVAAATGAKPVVTTASETNREIILGIGCRRGVSQEEVAAALRETLKEAKIELSRVRLAATTIRKRDEAGLTEACEALGIPLLFFEDWEIRRLKEEYGTSGAAKRNLALPGVSEPCALLAGRNPRLLGPRRVFPRLTVAVAREEPPAVEPETIEPEPAAGTPARTPVRGLLTVVGIGPGRADLLAPKARRAILEADLLVGYGKYLRLLGDLAEGKETFASGMRREEERAFHAVEAARSGKKVVLVSSGDAGIYGLAGLALELLSEKDIETLDFEVVPGITAASSCAALLGAPLTHDFAVISLSDLLTEHSLIEKRVLLAAEGDFVTVLYNPRSSKRRDLLEWTRDRLLEHRGSETPVGIVRDAGREKEWVRITNLRDLPAWYEEIDMGTTVIVGNSKTFRKGRFMVTPRGYKTG